MLWEYSDEGLNVKFLQFSQSLNDYELLLVNIENIAPVTTKELFKHLMHPLLTQSSFFPEMLFCQP